MAENSENGKKGCIIIDNIKIDQIGLHELRGKI